MAYLDKNGLNYYSQKVAGKIQDVQDDLDELKIIQEEEFEVVDVQWNEGRFWEYYEDENEYAMTEIEGGEESEVAIPVNNNEKYFISTFTNSVDVPAVILTSANSSSYNYGLIQDQEVIATYGNASFLYENIITIPQNTTLMIINNTSGDYTPIIKKITKEGVRVEKLADAAPMDSDVQSMLLEVFNNELTPQELEDLVFLSNVESEVF